MAAQWIILLLLLLPAPEAGYAPSHGYDIIEFGAVGDGKTMNTRSIQAAIDKAATSGGGLVCVPAGTFMTGTLRLRSNVELHLGTGAVLKGSDRLEDYYLDGKLVGLLFTQDAMNVSITGQGTIDGNGDSFIDLTRAKQMDKAAVRWTRQADRFREVAEGLGDGPAVPRSRPFQMIIFSDCRRVTVRDVLITNSPFWTLHLADCDGVVVSGVRIWCNLLVPNNDGLDITSCRHVAVSDCDIRTGDDAIAITGYSRHINLPGYKGLRHPCENITVSNCTLVSRSSGIRIGGWDQNPMRSMTFNNLTITDSNRGIGLFVRDQGGIEDLTFSNIVIRTRLHTGDWWGNGEPIHVSAVRLTKDVALGQVRNVKFQNMLCRAEAGILVYGTKESVIENLSFDNFSFRVEDSRLNDVAGGNFDLRPVLDPKLQLFSHDIPGFYAQWVKNLCLRDFDLQWGEVCQPFFTHGVEVTQFDGLTIDGGRFFPAPQNPGAHPIALRDGRRAHLLVGDTHVSRERVESR